MKSVAIVLFALVPVCVFASPATVVYDPTNHTESIILRNQTIANTTNLLNAIELSRKYLDAIRELNNKLCDEANTIKNKTDTIMKDAERIRRADEETVRVLGDPGKVSIDLTDLSQVTPANNRTLAEIKSVALSKASAEPDADLYGENADPKARYKIIETAYRNYEQVQTTLAPLKEKLILRRETLKDAIKKTATIGGQQKIATALLAVNGQLDDIEREERSAYQKLEAFIARKRIAEEQEEQIRQQKNIDYWNQEKATMFAPDADEQLERAAKANGAITSEAIHKLGAGSSISPGVQYWTKPVEETKK